MIIKNRMNQLIVFSENLPFAKVYLREDWDVFYFDVFGKMFGLMSPVANDDASLTLKNNPEKNEEWRELYPEIIQPGFHMNKKHWNTIKLDSELSNEVLQGLIKTSYDLVCNNLTKEQKSLIRQSNT